MNLPNPGRPPPGAPFLIQLVPACGGPPLFPVTYYAGRLEHGGDASNTQDLALAPRFVSLVAAEQVRAKLLNTMSCVWVVVDLSALPLRAEDMTSAEVVQALAHRVDAMNPTLEHSDLVRFNDLWVGDRFILQVRPNALWTKLSPDTARRHSDESIALGPRGHGYLGDTICSFEQGDQVVFQPPAQAGTATLKDTP